MKQPMTEEFLRNEEPRTATGKVSPAGKGQSKVSVSSKGKKASKRAPQNK